MSIRKQYLKSRPICKVTFRIPEDTGSAYEHVCITGDFNEWSHTATPMKKLKSGAFTCTVDLETGRDYQFRYVADLENWMNEEDADDHVETHFGDCRNSVIIL